MAARLCRLRGIEKTFHHLAACKNNISVVSSQQTEAVTKCDLTLSQTSNFRLFLTERVCRPQFQIDENIRKLFKQVENTVGKG